MILILVSSLSLGIWLFLLLFWGNFWRADFRLDRRALVLDKYPNVCAVVPARDEAESIASSLTSLLTQDYKGKFSVVLVDDNSSDRTTEIASQTGKQLAKAIGFKL